MATHLPRYFINIFYRSKLISWPVNMTDKQKLTSNSNMQQAKDKCTHYIFYFNCVVLVCLVYLPHNFYLSILLFLNLAPGSVVNSLGMSLLSCLVSRTLRPNLRTFIGTMTLTLSYRPSTRVDVMMDL